MALIHAEVDKALCRINVSKRPEVLILNCMADLTCKYIFPLVNVFHIRWLQKLVLGQGTRHWDLLPCSFENFHLHTSVVGGREG